MELIRGIDALSGATERSAVTIGFFDGVHRGHQAVFRTTVRAAGTHRLRPVAVTFDRHPREILTPGEEPKLLTTLERKADLIARLGIDVLVVLEFTEDFSTWPPAEFVQRVLVDGLLARHVVVGSNFTFGHRAAGNLATLADLGATCGYEGVPLLEIEGRPVSSSSIRETLAAGDLGWPAEAIGRRFVLDGLVTAGAGRGAGLGYPTANLEVTPSMLIPGQGVYAGTAIVTGREHAAAVNVGTNPTFGGEALHVEVFLLDFEGDVRGEPIAVEFWQRLRDEAKFDSAEALAKQIAQDVERTRAAVRIGSPGSVR